MHTFTLRLIPWTDTRAHNRSCWYNLNYRHPLDRCQKTQEQQKGAINFLCFPFCGRIIVLQGTDVSKLNI